jgi:hypothetical protein
MTITALNKMCHSQRQELKWSGVLVQTIQLPKDDTRLRANCNEAEKFLSTIGNPVSGSGRETRVWKGVSANAVAKFVEALQFPPESARASGQQLGTFIRQQTAKPAPELTSWTVALVSVQDASVSRSVGGYEIGLAQRTPEQVFASSYSLKKANILNPADESTDFAGVTFDQEWFDMVATKPELSVDAIWLREQVGRDAAKVALDLTLRWQQTEPPKLLKRGTGETTRPNGRVMRVLRKRTHGLILVYPLEPLAQAGVDPNGPAVVGVALSFPTSDTVLGVEYRVNRVWGAEMQEDDQYDNDN